MNVYNLTHQLIFMGGETFYTPPDPFNIYFRLATLYLKANNRKSWVKKSEIVKPENIFNENDYWKEYESITVTYKPIHFIKWLLQEIPECFWKFNVLIDVNREKLVQSAKDSIKGQIWINMVGAEKKFKAVGITTNVLSDLKNKTFYLPTYKEIAHEVPKWGDYKYAYGDIKEQLVKGVNI